MAARAEAIYFVHGSGFVLCSPRTHRRLTSWLSQLTGLPVFSIDYRLAPKHRFPTAADDVRTGWDWLIHDQGMTPQRTVIEFRHTAPDPQTIWMVLDHGEASVCLQHPGFESDVVATASTPAFADVFQGYQRWSEAVDAGRIEVAGPRRLASALSTWFRWSPWAAVTRERADRAATGPYAAESATHKGAPQHSARRTPPSVPTGSS